MRFDIALTYSLFFISVLTKPYEFYVERLKQHYALFMEAAAREQGKVGTQ